MTARIARECDNPEVHEEHTWTLPPHTRAQRPVQFHCHGGEYVEHAGVYRMPDGRLVLWMGGVVYTVERPQARRRKVAAK